MLTKKKVIVAMSGGIDSSVAAFLLKQAGYEVTGIFLRLTSGQEKSEAAARTTARKLKIKFYPLSASSRFQKEVVDYFLNSYASGLTPNPCIRCNKVVKFSSLLNLTSVLGGDFLATGHYVRCLKEKDGRYHLYRGRDKKKDQSYFLYTLAQKQLSQLLFPLAELTKEKARKIASKNGLPHLVGESQDVCFLVNEGKTVPHNEFLKKHLKLESGPIKTLNGEIIGKHHGLPLYTIGQRRGVEIGGRGPFYVARTDYQTNTLYVVDNRNHRALFRRRFRAEKVNWIRGQEPAWPLKCEAVIRYRHQPEKVTVKSWPVNKRNNKEDIFYDCLVEFEHPQRAVTPGQSVVFYQNNEVLGGGIISLDREGKML
jgi:tRNA-specific 2-thiouridylase